MKNSTRYFCNRECECYPCHRGIDDLHCLFCYCPLFHIQNCPGNYVMTEIGGKQVKDCSDCIFPHLPKNYDKIIDILNKVK